tara:strand:+ start:897 stop:1433 length:537 start_codon:yes stop_codon:yes gene_type:complete
MILGLDVSTSITGATVIDKDGEILFCESWDTRNKKRFPTLWEKAAFIEDRLKELKVRRGYTIEKVYVEESLQTFKSGFSSAKTLSTLSKFNGIVSFICYKVFDLQPEFVGASSARKLCGIKVERGKKAKEVVLQHLLDNEPSFSVEYTKHGNPTPGSWDRSDSIIIARAGLKKWESGN